MALPTLAHRIDGPAASTAAPLSLLHDLAGDCRLWRPLRPLLSQQRRTISIDLRGHGEPPVPPLGDGYDVATHAADMLRLFDALDVERAVLVGRRGWRHGCRRPVGVGARSRAARTHDPDPRERVVNRWRIVHAEGYIGSAHALLDRPDHTADLSTLRMPQLWLVGQLSVMCEAITGVAALAPQARIEQVKLTGIGCAWQHHGHWADYVNAFLADVDAGAFAGRSRPA